MAQATEPNVATKGVRRIIERPRLLRLLDETTARTILLIAPAGYGKTTLARQWVEGQTGAYWYTARAGSADIAQLVMGLAEALDPAAPGFSEYVSQLVRAMPNPTQNAAEIADGIVNFAGDLSAVTIVVDDHHVVAENEAASAMLRTLQERLGFKLVVTSRLRPTWATARLQMYGELLELGSDELALTDEEALEVLGETARRHTDLVERARGWPAVVSLAAQANTARSSPADDTASTLFRFFAEELFRATPLELQAKLITLSLLPRLSKDLVEAALGRDQQAIVDQVVESGLASPGPEFAELHPLVRDYLLTKLDVHEDDQRIRAAFRLSLEHGLWDHAFELIERFKLFDLLDPLIEHSFKPLLSSGRIGTLEHVATYAHVTAAHTSPLVELVDAELAFRLGLLKRVEPLAEKVAREFGGDHPLASHAWWIAGQGAQLASKDGRAAEHFRRAYKTAQGDDDLRESFWGLVITAVQSEDGSTAEATEQLRKRRGNSPVDLVRLATAQLQALRLGAYAGTTDVEEAMHVLDGVTDPRIQTGFLNQYAYHLILGGQYDAAYEITERLYRAVNTYQLTWAAPHAQWALAAASLGRRQFRAADDWLRRVETAADQLRYGQLVLNAGCLRCRMLLAMHRFEDARSALNVDETLPAHRAMRGEFLATKALAIAILEPSVEVAELVETASEITRSVESRAYSACATAIVAQRSNGPDSDVLRSIEIAEQLDVWDALVCALRGWPPLLETIVHVPRYRAKLVAVLRNSHDYDLARRVGLDLGRRPQYPSSITTLSPREREVLELVGQGLTNADIASALFISESTVKVHVRHILEKTGARSRTEAATTLQLDAR
jgi:ATP/maltotriose-dependent transcriptional regulator MalT